MAMQNLRDKLLKAGLVDKKQKQQVDTQDRRDKKQKGAEQLAAEEAERKRLFAEKQAAEIEAARQIELERAAERAKHEDEYRVRSICDRWAVRQRRPGQRRFYVVQRSGKLTYLQVGDDIAQQLYTGALAIVERLSLAESQALADVTPVLESGKPPRRAGQSLVEQLRSEVQGKRGSSGGQGELSATHVLLPPEPAERVLAIDPSAIRFWARSESPLGFIRDPEAAPALPQP